MIFCAAFSEKPSFWTVQVIIKPCSLFLDATLMTSSLTGQFALLRPRTVHLGDKYIQHAFLKTTIFNPLAAADVSDFI